MILWIDGAYGIGKTTIANKIADRLNQTKFIVLDSDYYYRELGKKNPFSIMSGGTTPQNNINFLYYFKSIIDGKILNDESVIITMAATMKECKEILIKYLSERNDFVHIILEASKETIISRIEEDTTGNRDKKFAVDYLDENIKFLTKNYDAAVRVNTGGKSIDCVVDEIIKYCY